MKFLKQLLLFLVFGAIYYVMESTWKGYPTHWSMFLVAGAIGSAIGAINEYIPWKMPFPCQCIIGMVIAVLGEAAAGAILNLWLGLNIWHYNVLPFFWNQCSVPFALVWLGLAGFCIWLDDWLRYKWFGEEYPHYTWI
jgi:hypothetical protein